MGEGTDGHGPALLQFESEGRAHRQLPCPRTRKQRMASRSRGRRAVEDQQVDPEGHDVHQERGEGEAMGGEPLNQPIRDEGS